MPEQHQSERLLYKSIVIGMGFCLPAGIALGFARENIVLGLLAGNTLGIAIGLAVNSGIKRNNRR